MAWLIQVFPFGLGLLLILTGTGMIIYRKKGFYHISGRITGIAKRQRKYSRVKVLLEAPAVRYTLKGREYDGVSRRFYTDGIKEFKEGKSINIRVKRTNPRRFVPEESGRTAEKLVIGCGIFMIIANAVILWRY